MTLNSRASLFACTMLMSFGAFGTQASAQATLPAPEDNSVAPDTNGSGLQEIVVTAQKRAQNQQDVPISMTTITDKILQANRITSVIDLSAAVPNLAARPSAGGSQLPAFTMRGITSYGVVPGSDKELSVYIDGVYIASTVGSMLDLPDLAQIEVLRGPQGTLFGRNATVGAISVITRDPPTKFGFQQELTYGNYSEFRTKTRLDLGSFGPFSATVSFVHEQRDGDIRNLGAGTTFTFPASAEVPTTQVSPATLGAKNVNTVFAAVKFEPSDSISVTNKFDWTGNHYTPAGAAVVGVDPAALGPAGGGFLSLVLATQSNAPNFVTNGERPDAVNNSFSLPAYARDWGDSLTAQFHVSSHLSFKNILAYRSSYVRANDQLDGLGGLTVTPGLAAFIPAFAPLVGSPFAVFSIQQVSTSDQWSDELQANYNSRFVTITAGALWFHTTSRVGGPGDLPNDIALEAVPFGQMALIANPQVARNKATSIAAYLQAEAHVTPQIDLIGGVRVTHDRKSGDYNGQFAFNYNDTEPSFSVGINYKPSRDLLLYAKYSTAFVSGGANGPITYLPEKAKSWELGIKSDWLDHRLRANLALFDVKYTDLQSAQGGITLHHPELNLVVADQGDVRARGFEFESTIVPISGVTLGVGVGYTDLKFLNLNPTFAADAAQQGIPLTLQNYLPTLQPKWTTNLSAEYDTPPIFGGSNMTFRVDASWHDRERTDPYTVYEAAYPSLTYSPATWLINGRVSLDHIKLPYGEGQIAVWAKNLTDSKGFTFPDILGGFVAGTEFQPARTFGVDVRFTY